MASERQIAANRRNAKRSTGPQSSSGKRRSSQNAHRHGLAKSISTVEFDAQLEKLARQIAGDTDDAATLGLARVAVEADLDLARARKVKAAMIARALAQGGFDGARYFRSDMAEIHWHYSGIRWRDGKRPSRSPQPESADLSTARPEDEEERFAEAVRRILPELNKIIRYESRAAGRRDRAIRKVTKSLTGLKND
jgi:hypothetical protein